MVLDANGFKTNYSKSVDLGNPSTNLPAKSLKVTHILCLKALSINERTKARSIARFQDSIKLLSESYSGRGGI